MVIGKTNAMIGLSVIDSSYSRYEHTVSAEDRPPIGVKAGEMYPDFLLPTLDGELHRFSEYRGKKILLFHFASW